MLHMVSSSGRQGSICVRQYRPEEAAELHEMLNTAFRPRSPEAWRWRFVDAPAGPATIHVLEQEGRLMGQVAVTPMSGFFDGHRHRFALAGGALVVPEVRGKAGGLRRLLGAGMNQAAAQGHDLVLAFPKDRFLVLLQRVTGGAVLGRICNWVHWDDVHALQAGAGRRLAWYLRPVAAGALKLILALSRRPDRSIRLVELLDWDEGVRAELNRLADRSAGFARCICVRDAAYLRWRWLEQPDSNWRFFAAYGPDGELSGFCVFDEVQSDDGSRTGRIVDVLAGDLRSLRALIRVAVRALTAAGCHIVTCTYQDPRRWSRLAMRLEGFFARKGGPPVLQIPLCSPVKTVAQGLEAWYLTLGDTDIV